MPFHFLARQLLSFSLGTTTTFGYRCFNHILTSSLCKESAKAQGIFPSPYVHFKSSLSLSLSPSSMRIRWMPLGDLLEKQNTIERKKFKVLLISWVGNGRGLGLKVNSLFRVYHRNCPTITWAVNQGSRIGKGGTKSVCFFGVLQCSNKIRSCLSLFSLLAHFLALFSTRLGAHSKTSITSFPRVVGGELGYLTP